MFSLTKTTRNSKATALVSRSLIALVRHLSASSIIKTTTRKEGDISSVFVSLSGVSPDPLPSRFADIKRQLIQGHEKAVTASWKRLLQKLATENEALKQRGSAIIPEIQFEDLKNPSEQFLKETKKRGVAVIRSVVPEDEARAYKTEVEDYVKINPWTKGISTFCR